MLAAQAGPSLSKNDRDIVLTMLREIEQDVEKHYYDPSFHGIDLKARAREAEQRLKTTASFNEAIATLAELFTHLDDSHTTFMPPNRRVRVSYGWEMAMV